MAAAAPAHGGSAGVRSVVVILMAVARPRGAWRSHLVFSALAGVAVIDSVIATIIYTTSANDPNVNDIALGVSALFWVGVGVLALVALLIGRRRLSNVAVVALIFLTLVGATDALGALPSIGITVPRLGIDRTPRPSCSWRRCAASPRRPRSSFCLRC